MPTSIAKFLALPIALSQGAWREAVDSANPLSILSFSTRLTETIQAAYRSLVFQPDASRIDFGLYRLPPTGDQSYRVWLDLRLDVIENEEGPNRLLISLRDEQPF